MEVVGEEVWCNKGRRRGAVTMKNRSSRSGEDEQRVGEVFWMCCWH